MRIVLTGWLFLLASSVHAQGTITGKLDQPGTVKSIIAIDRTWLDEQINKPMQRAPIPVKFDAATGEFALTLPANQVVDLIIDYENGARLEGVNLKVKRSDYIEEDPPLTTADDAKLRELTKRLSKFENEHQIFTVTGNVQHACVLVNRLKTEDFYLKQPGEVIWRLELLHFEKPDDADYWVKSQDRVFVLYYRERLQRKAYDAKSITFDPQLGGLRATSEQPKLALGLIPAPDAKAGLHLRNPPAPPVKVED